MGPDQTEVDSLPLSSPAERLRSKERLARDEQNEDRLASITTPSYFNPAEFLSQTGERNYCLQLYCEQRGELLNYLHEKGADNEQIAQVLKQLAEITKE
jgi:hypothetical protein